MQPKVSIIVAAYNIEQYIFKCLESLVSQTFKNIEIIVVNDGSTDNTLSITNEMSINDNRIKIINKKNEGSIEARKSGYKEAKGKYIIFVDGDDWIEKNTIEILYNKAVELDYDIVGFKFLWAHDDGKLDKSNQKTIEDINGSEFIKLILIGDIIPSLWSKFIKKSFIDRNKIEFPQGVSFAEDLAFTCSLGVYQPKVCVIDEYLYYYYQRENSITKVVSPKLLEIAKCTNFIKNKLIENNLFDKYREEFEYLAFYHNYLLRIGDIYHTNSEYSKLLYKSWKAMNINIYNNKYYKNLTQNYNIKSKLIYKLCEKNYILGIMYHKYNHNKSINK